MSIHLMGNWLCLFFVLSSVFGVVAPYLRGPVYLIKVFGQTSPDHQLLDWDPVLASLLGSFHER